ncbi:MAG TPA: hypothetical protein VMR49_03920 [Candidatus Paceibacterota bacterium]|jgi:hypothetical protein|nr:hypothetical protein [Candidatus Paceibacterota bacterium]
MKPITIKRNVKAQVPMPVKENNKKEFVLKHRPNLKPQNKRAKVRV